jgi:conjugative transfer region protein (TIGR03748 family)
MSNVKRCLVVAVTVVLSQAVCAQTRLVEGGAEIQVGRYTTVASTPPASESAPLAVYARIGFPRATVATVGEALRHTLTRTGYRMVDPAGMDPVALRFMDLPLPDSQREIGPYKVVDILQTLLGPAWQLQRDPVSRKVWFSVAPGYERYAADATAASRPTPSAPITSASPSPSVQPSIAPAQ